MGIKSFFKNLGRKISSGFNNLVSGAGNAIGSAATFLQRKAIPAIAGGATKASELLGKLAPALDAANPEIGAAAGEAGQVLGKVGDVTSKFAKFIGSDLPAQGTPMNEQQIAATLQSPLIAAFRRSSGQKPLDAAGAAALSANYTKTGSATLPAPAPAAAAPKYTMGLAKPIDFSKIMKPALISPAPTPAPSPFAKAGAAFKPLIGSNPATYTPSGIEAPPPAKPTLAVMSGGTGGIKPMLG